MPAHHNFTTQTTRQTRFAHGNNAVAYFLCRSSDQEEQRDATLKVFRAGAFNVLYLWHERS
jgi:hypothetical protein